VEAVFLPCKKEYSSRVEGVQVLVVVRELPAKSVVPVPYVVLVTVPGKKHYLETRIQGTYGGRSVPIWGPCKLQNILPPFLGTLFLSTNI